MRPHNEKVASHLLPTFTPNRMSHSSVPSSMRMPAPVIRLLVVADYPVVRHGLRQIFGGAADIHIVGEARGAMDLIKQTDVCRPDAVLIDFAGKSSYHLFCRLQKHDGRLPILIFSAAHDRYAKKAFQRGAMGYVTKDHVPDHLVLAIRQISQGEKYVWPQIVSGSRSEFGSIAAAWLGSIVKVWNPLVLFPSDKPSLHR
jgi:DNA-binding NarL/FixJ family response regulator